MVLNQFLRVVTRHVYTSPTIEIFAAVLSATFWGTIVTFDVRNPAPINIMGILATPPKATPQEIRPY